MMQEYLDICERSLRQYMANSGSQFESDRAVMMLKCNVICRSFYNQPEGELICFLCASICVDCMDPHFSLQTEEIGYKFQKLMGYLRKDTDWPSISI